MKPSRALLLALSLSLAFTLGALFRDRLGGFGLNPDYLAQVAAARVAVSTSQGSSEESHGQSVPAIVTKLRPSVVSITATTGNEKASAGTGVIVHESGFILTNLHVVDGAERVTAMLSSKDWYEATVVGVDALTDLALLKIKVSEGLLPVEFGDSDALVVGQDVVAVGSAYGFGWSVSHGIISSLHRSSFANKTREEYTDYIQTDAAINPGNSGGPLVDRLGRVIGINSAIVTETGMSAGLGFALPSQDARFVAEQLMKSGAVQRAYLGVRGVSLSELSRSARRKLGADTAHGVLVEFVEPDSPAERAGFRTKDVILSVADLHVEDMQVLRSRVARVPVGTEVAFQIIRDKQPVSISAVAVLKPPPTSRDS